MRHWAGWSICVLGVLIITSTVSRAAVEGAPPTVPPGTPEVVIQADRKTAADAVVAAMASSWHPVQSVTLTGAVFGDMRDDALRALPGVLGIQWKVSFASKDKGTWVGARRELLIGGVWVASTTFGDPGAQSVRKALLTAKASAEPQVAGESREPGPPPPSLLPSAIPARPTPAAPSLLAPSAIPGRPPVWQDPNFRDFVWHTRKSQDRADTAALVLAGSLTASLVMVGARSGNRGEVGASLGAAAVIATVGTVVALVLSISSDMHRRKALRALERLTEMNPSNCDDPVSGRH